MIERVDSQDLLDELSLEESQDITKEEEDLIILKKIETYPPATDYEQYDANSVPKTFYRVNSTPGKLFKPETYLPIVLNAPIIDFEKMYTQEPHLTIRMSDLEPLEEEQGEIDSKLVSCSKYHPLLVPGQKLEYTFEDETNEVPYDMFFDQEADQIRRKQHVQALLSRQFRFKYERLEKGYLIQAVLGDGSFGFVVSGVRYIDGLKVRSSQEFIINY